MDLCGVALRTIRLLTGSQWARVAASFHAAKTVATGAAMVLVALAEKLSDGAGACRSGARFAAGMGEPGRLAEGRFMTRAG